MSRMGLRGHRANGRLASGARGMRRLTKQPEELAESLEHLLHRVTIATEEGSWRSHESRICEAGPDIPEWFEENIRLGRQCTRRSSARSQSCRPWQAVLRANTNETSRRNHRATSAGARCARLA